MQNKDLSYEIYIAASPAQVWKSFFDPTMVSRLFFGSKLRADMKVGGKLEYIGPGPEGPETVHIYGKILALKEQEEFAYSYKVGNAYGDRERFESRVCYKLKTVGKTTHLSMLHDSWMDGDPAYENTKSGWPMVLSALKSGIECDMTLDFGDLGH